tara:strand:+ start:507 stop:752 length:246 start_codon:yes stop_codon:yes gene_type:complete
MYRQKRPPKLKNDPPLPLQYNKGYGAFSSTKQWTRKVDDATIIVTACPFKEHTMQAREWQRGYNKAYFDNLEKLHEVNGRR